MFGGLEDGAPTQVPTFLLGSRAVTNADFLRFVSVHAEWRRSQVPGIAADSTYLRHWAGDVALGALAPANAPVVNVSWFAAVAYAEWAGARLPTAVEWERAIALGVVSDPGSRVGPETVWAWVDDFNGVITSGESRADAGPDNGLFCAAGALRAADPTDYGLHALRTTRFAARPLHAERTGDLAGARRARRQCEHASVLGAPMIRTCAALLFVLSTCRASVSSAQRVAAESSPLPSASLYALGTIFTDHTGARAPLASLRGTAAVLSLVYLSCTMTCPRITSDMLSVQSQLTASERARVRFVLVTFDPARDSLVAMRAYAAGRQLDAQWALLRGSPTDIRRLAVALGVNYRQLASGDFDHANVITVLDRDGVVLHQEVRLPLDRERLMAAVRAAAR